MTDTADPKTGEITDEVEVDPAAIRSFQNLIMEQRFGALATEASEALNDLIAAVQEHGKGGSVSVTFRVKPAGKGKGDRRILQITDEVNVKTPEAERESALFYATDSNGLSREDPRQQKFSLAEVPPTEVRDTPTSAPVREVGN